MGDRPSFVILNRREDLASTHPVWPRVSLDIESSGDGLHEQIANGTLPTQPIPRFTEVDDDSIRFQLHGSAMSGEVGWPHESKSANGSPLVFFYPPDLDQLDFAGREPSPFNKAALAYVRALPDDWPVIVYWH